MSDYSCEILGLGPGGKCVRVLEPAESSIEIQGSVGHQGRNAADDVLTIQQALNKVPVGQGRPSPLLVLDGLNGPKTESAIYKFQVLHFGASKADARVDPGHRTIAKLNELQPSQLGGNGATVIPTSRSVGFMSFSPLTKKDTEVMTQVQAGMAVALAWTITARLQLQNAVKYTKGEKKFVKSYDLVDRCFMIKSLKSDDKAAKAMSKIDQILQTMPTASTATTPFLRKEEDKHCTTDTGGLVFARAVVGGYHSKTKEHKQVTICTKNMAGKSTTFMADAMVHEMAHLVGPMTGDERIVHGGRAKPAYGLDALKLSHSEAMKSASNYAWLAWLARLPESEWMTNTG